MIGHLSKIDNVLKNESSAKTIDKAAGGIGETEKRHNTIIRLINVIFSEGYIEGFLKWNDQRTRFDHETGVGGKMQRWFSEVHDAMYTVNNSGTEYDVIDNYDNNDDSNNTDEYGKIDLFVGHVNSEKIQQYINLANLDPSDYLMISSVILRDYVTKLVKARTILI
jgi:hypothetical protein